MKRIALFTAAALTVAGTTLYSRAQDGETAQTQPAEQTPAAAETQAQPQTPPQAQAPAAQAAVPAEGGELDVERVSYAIGYMMGREYRRNEIDLQADAFAEGMATGLAGDDARLSQAELQATLMDFQRQMQLRQARKMQAQAAEGQALLEENRAKEGVQVTESGLQFEVVEAGEGQSPGPQDTVRVHYRGTLPDGTQFDSSYDRGEPAEFRVNEVIPGWSEALQMMKPGGEYRLVVPSELAYGEMSPSPMIPPNSVLVFKVELLDVLGE